MVKTTQKIYFPESFKMPGTKHTKKESMASLPVEESSPSPERRQVSPDHRISQLAKKAVVNLETNSELSLEVMPRGTVAIGNSQKD